ncbi:unnamed protein product, partial [Chrysoparadoxa australica]
AQPSFSLPLRLPGWLLLRSQEMSLTMTGAFHATLGPHPNPAGISNEKRVAGDTAQCISMDGERPETPAKLKQLRRTREPGKRVLHPGCHESDYDTARNFRPGGTKPSDHVKDVWKEEDSSSELRQIKRDLAEKIYQSKRQSLGKSLSRGHKLPDATKNKDFAFGISSNHSHDVKSLLYPQPTEAEMAGLDLYRRSHRSFLPGEQVRQGYDWDIDVERHRFGRQDGKVALNGASFNIQAVLNPEQQETSRLTSMKLDNFHNTQHLLGRSRNLGMDPRDHLGDHVYGKAAIRKGPDEWDARACIEGDYDWEEQQPDADLSKSITPGFRNLTTENRAFGVPSVGRQALVTARDCMEEAEDDLYKSYTAEEVRGLFKAIGYSFDEEEFGFSFEEVWEKVQVDGMCTIVTFQG